MKATWTKVYSGPGYPIDPQREMERLIAEGPQYSCEIIGGNREHQLTVQYWSLDRPWEVGFSE